jgi:hypothetical protein
VYTPYKDGFVAVGKINDAGVVVGSQSTLTGGTLQTKLALYDVGSSTITLVSTPDGVPSSEGEGAGLIADMNNNGAMLFSSRIKRHWVRQGGQTKEIIVDGLKIEQALFINDNGRVLVQDKDTQIWVLEPL